MVNRRNRQEFPINPEEYKELKKENDRLEKTKDNYAVRAASANAKANDLRQQVRDLKDGLKEAQKGGNKLSKDLIKANNDAANQKAKASVNDGKRRVEAEQKKQYELRINGNPRAPAGSDDHRGLAGLVTDLKSQVQNISVDVANKDGIILGKDQVINVEQLRRQALELELNGDPANNRPGLRDQLTQAQRTAANEKYNTASTFYRIIIGLVAAAGITLGIMAYNRPPAQSQKPAVEEKGKPAGKSSHLIFDEKESSKAEEPFKYHSIEAFVEGVWYDTEKELPKGKVPSAYRIALRNKDLAGKLEETVVNINGDAIEGPEGYKELLKKLGELLPKQYAKLAITLPGLNTKDGGDKYTATNKDLKAAHTRATGGYKTIVGEE